MGFDGTLGRGHGAAQRLEVVLTGARLRFLLVALTYGEGPPPIGASPMHA